MPFNGNPKLAVSDHPEEGFAFNGSTYKVQWENVIFCQSYTLIS